MTVTMNVQITLVPDQSTGNEFPQAATQCQIIAQYSTSTARTFSAAFPNPKAASQMYEWDNVPAGGTVNFIVSLTDPNGWGVGKGQSGVIANVLTDGPYLKVTISIAQQLYPIGPNTTYDHRFKLTYPDLGQDDRMYVWDQTDLAPTATVADLGTGPSGQVLERLHGITLSDDLGILGYGWQASGLNVPPIDDDTSQTELFMMQNIGFKPIANDATWPEAGFMTAPAGYSKGARLLYLRSAQGTPSGAVGTGCFFLDPSGDRRSGYHLRQVTPVTDSSIPTNSPQREFDLATGTSFGRFSVFPTSLAIHSNGYVAAVNSLYNTLQILKLPPQGVPDAQALWAFMPTGSGSGPGRLDAPTLVAIRPDQTILVLEAGNARIQAFSCGGHPVSIAPLDAEPFFWAPLVSHGAGNSNVVYTGMSVDVAGYAYVTSYNGNGYDASDFYLDIYTPTGTHLCAQNGFIAADLAVDLWRNVYTLNFEEMSGWNSQTQPSVSEWVPNTPKPASIATGAPATGASATNATSMIPTSTEQAPMGSAIATWTFSQYNKYWPNGSLPVRIYTSQYGYAGGFVLVGFGGGATSFQVFNLGNSRVAMMAMVTDVNGSSWPNYWNSHYGTSQSSSNGGMMTWNASNSGSYEPHNNANGTGLAAEQTFTLSNLGDGNISLQAVGGAFAGSYLCGMNGGWYPTQWGLGTGSFIGTSGEAAIQMHGDQLPILIITSSGYKLNLPKANLGTINLSGFNMRGCNLSGADLTGVTGWQTTDFTQAVLNKANLDGQDLAGATWNKATFIGSDLRLVKSMQKGAMPGAVFDGANLAGVRLDGADLTGATFRGATLDGAVFEGAHLEGAVFDGATLGKANFERAHMQGTSFNNCDLTSTYFGAGPDFTRSAGVQRTRFIDATVPFTLLGQNWSWLDLSGATITGLPKTIVELIADQALLPDGVDLGGMNLSGASFVGTRMYSANLQGTNLQGAVMAKARLKQAQMHGANLTNATLDSAYLIAEQKAETAGALLAGGANGQGPSDLATILADLEPAKLIGAFMFNTVLDGAHCDGVDFSNAYFLTAAVLGAGQTASALAANMNFAIFNQTKLALTVFDGAQLSAANFSGASLVGASFQDYDGSAVELTPASDVVHTAATVSGADIRGTNFTGANMMGLNMVNAVYSTAPGIFSAGYPTFDGQQVLVAFNFGVTVLGNTTNTTTCPDNTTGPCVLPIPTATS